MFAWLEMRVSRYNEREAAAKYELRAHANEVRALHIR